MAVQRRGFMGRSLSLNPRGVHGSLVSNDTPRYRILQVRRPIYVTDVTATPLTSPVPDAQKPNEVDDDPAAMAVAQSGGVTVTVPDWALAGSKNPQTYPQILWIAS
ncbi:MAG: hypothetical protein EB012_12270 [Gammaproteobacteria bacterium]|nr:hypothetical protein [Gammaproteobacteria bacterium]